MTKIEYFYNCDDCICPKCPQYKAEKCEATYDEVLDIYMGRCPGCDTIECYGYQECPLEEEWREWDEQMFPIKY